MRSLLAMRGTSGAGRDGVGRGSDRIDSGVTPAAKSRPLVVLGVGADVIGRLRHLICGGAIGVLATTFAAASDLPVRPDRLPDYYGDDGKPQWVPAPEFIPPPRRLPMWEGELGGRYWYSSGKSQIDLYGFVPSTDQVSRLTYSKLHSHVGEIFGRVEHVTGVFAKGFVGGGKITSGTLRDEDFPPFIVPYSSTDSEQRDGRLVYGTVDLGWNWRTPGTKLGAFVGYLYYFERLNAYGCIQTASNPFICVPSIPTSVLGITQETTWHAIRLGVSGEWRFRSGLRLNAEVAWLPYTVLSAKDFHWLRIPSDFSGAIPERGSTVASVQIEVLLAYDFSNAFSVGIGGRYWNIGTGTGGATAHFEQAAAFGAPQSLAVRTERWGGFLQASYKFGELRPSARPGERAQLF